MAKEPELTAEQALQRANEALQDPVLSQLGIKLSDPAEAGLRIAVGLADAASADALLAEGDANGWEGQEGRSFLVRSADFLPSTKPGALGIYAVVQVVDVDTNEPMTLTTGATNVVIQVAKMLQKGWTDVPVALSIKPTADGNTVHRLRKGDVGTSSPF